MALKHLAVAVPASIVSDTPHLREKTSKIGSIGRAAAIFRANEIIIYPDNPKADQKREIEFVATVLSYIETPQYLRKRLFKLSSDLQFAGILPPLRTPHHPLNWRAKDLQIGQYREGAVISKTLEGVLVDIGVEQPAFLRDGKFDVYQRLTVKVSQVSPNRVEVEAADRSAVPVYWGYNVKVEPHSFTALVKNGRYDLTIGTSKFAVGFSEAAEALGKKWQKAEHILVAFGAPARGLFEIARDEGVNLNELLDFVVNTIPFQGTETVRTEEAFLASLAIFNEHFQGRN